MKPTCGQCRFYQATADMAGECRRKSPQGVIRVALHQGKTSNGCFDAFWPIVSATDWCGEWQPLPVKEEERPT